MGSQMTDDLGKLILRLALGILILFHGIGKLMGGIGFVTGAVSSAGLPEFVAYGVYVGEVLGPILLILGWHARIGAALIAINMLFAFGLAHLGQLGALANSGGWALELQGMYLFTAVALFLTGPGRLSINGR